MEIERLNINELIADPNNARKHDAKNIMAIKGSLAKFGQQKPIVVNAKNIVIAGNGTLQAASELGWTEIDIVRSNLEGFNAAAYGLADNRTSELASWDSDALNATLEALNSVDFDLPSIGFELGDFDEKPPRDIDGSKELNEDEFSDFENKCPRCGFEFNAKD
jgi:site-specific DNA-methyltransferase (adenine-specific)